MTTVSNNSQNNPAYSIDEAVKQSVNVSDATQLENNFLTLMVAQIQNQDPTKPVDSTEFLNQFAAMSQVKSLENMASLSKSNLVLLDNLQTLTAAGLVGQGVKVATEPLELGADKVKGEINLEHAAGTLAPVEGSVVAVHVGLAHEQRDHHSQVIEHADGAAQHHGAEQPP